MERYISRAKSHAYGNNFCVGFSYARRLVLRTEVKSAVKEVIMFCQEAQSLGVEITSRG